MADVVVLRQLRRRRLRRLQLPFDRRIFRDHQNPLEVFDDDQVYRKFRFRREDILHITNEIEHHIDFPLPRKGSLTPLLKVLLTLRFYATGTFYNPVGEMIGVSESTVCRTVQSVTNGLLAHAREHICMPSQEEADRSKIIFYNIAGFPSCFAAIDGTHVAIQAPAALQHEYRNRKNFTSINVQVRLKNIYIFRFLRFDYLHLGLDLHFETRNVFFVLLKKCYRPTFTIYYYYSSYY